MSVTQTSLLREAYGDEIILFDEQDESTVFYILKEFKFGDHQYAVLQSDELKKEDEVAIFRVLTDAKNQLELETIEDDEEWETVSELYDEMMFPEELR